jgi:hypothetical protein
MKVGYLPFRDDVASVRLRSIIPSKEMQKMGIEIGFGGTFIAQKHGFAWSKIPEHDKLIFDVCDNHFHDHLAQHYRYGCMIADQLTCNSQVMKSIIKEETGRDAVVIPEPYESPELEPTIGPNLFWFGNKINIKQIENARFKYPLTVLTNYDGYDKWTPERFAEEIRKHCIVVIPTGENKAKSENRMVESIRCGKYVCAGDMPSYEPFYRFFPCMDINEHIELALDEPDVSMRLVAYAQDYIRDRYSPETITKKWIEVING